MSHQGVALAIMQKRSVIRGVKLSELVSIRELAKRLGVSDTTVRRAIKKGRIFDSAIVGSKLDFDLASKLQIACVISSVATEIEVLVLRYPKGKAFMLQSMV